MIADRMKTNATSGPVFSFYFSISILVILISISDKTHAKPREEKIADRTSNNNYVHKGCSTFGHNCFGGHGKRFDSTMRRNTLQRSISQNIQEAEVPSPNNDELRYVLPNEKFRERSDQPFMRIRKDIRQFDVYPLSSLVERWIQPKQTDRKVATQVEGGDLRVIRTSRVFHCYCDNSAKYAN